jgi:hypothetical protein
MESQALIAFNEDVRKRGWKDWLRSHTSFLEPLHRYVGVLSLEYSRLEFRGVDSKTGEPFMTTVSKHDIEQLYYGFDDCYSRFETRSLGIGWMPIRLTLSAAGDDVKYLYLIMNYKAGGCDNDVWMEAFKRWLL